MRVAVVTPVISHFEVPVFRHLDAAEHLSSRVFHSDPLHRDHFDEAYGVNIDWGQDLSLGYSQQGFADMGAQLRQALWGWEPDVILLYGYSWPGALRILLEARARGIRVVHRGLLSHLVDPRSNTVSRVWRLIRPIVLRLFNAHHFGGDFSLKVLKAAGVAQADRYMVPFSVDSPHFIAEAGKASQIALAAELRRRQGWSSDDPVVLYLAQHSWVKGPDLMVGLVARAQADLPDLKLIMAGSGPMMEGLKAEAEATLVPGSFSFPGYIPSFDTTPYYLAADLSVFPSRHETWGRAVNEAMLCGRAVLVTDRVAASGGLVEDGVTGLVSADLSPEHLARRVVEYFQSSAADRERLAAAARQRALDYSYEAWRESLLRSVTDA
jgi:glycosyltransferase involved in cell wall biosynthesis